MKVFIVVILAAVCGLAMCGSVEWEENAKACGQKHNVKAEDVKDAIHGKTKADDVTPDMKCFSLCMAEKSNIIKNGAFQPDTFADNIPHPIDKDVLEKIKSECNLKGTDDCDTGFKVVSCVAKMKKA